MKGEQEKLIHFQIANMRGVSVTHGYNISNIFPVHFHSTYTLGIIEQGEREFFYRGEKIILKPNDIFIVQPFELHTNQSNDNSSHSYKVISFNLDPIYYFPQLVINQINLLTEIKDFHSIAEYEQSSSRLLSLYESIIKELKTYSVKYCEVKLNEEISTKIILAKEFIEHNCDRDISLKEMANIACLSEFYFNRYFHKCFGLSPYAYYLVCKMKKSQHILLKQNSIIETTYNIGFFDQSHYTKLFKKHIGVTPGRYLRDNKKTE